MIKLFKKRTYNFDFLARRKIGYTIAAALFLISVVAFGMNGLNYGIDFKGGVLVEVTAPQKVNMDALRSQLSFLKDLSMQSIGTEDRSILIQTRPDDGDTGPMTVQKIKDTLGADYSFDRVETIGPRIGSELKEKSLLASALALLAIAIYIWFRFEWPFAIGCTISLAYNLIVIVGAFALFFWEFDMIVVAGLLSLAGYACNDTIVTYDRVRENLRKTPNTPTDKLLNLSLNETLSRTILTGCTTFFVLIILLIVGGQTLRGFSIAMSLGVVVGTFTSIFLAVPLLRYFDIHSVAIKPDASGPYSEARRYEQVSKR